MAIFLMGLKCASYSRVSWLASLRNLFLSLNVFIVVGTRLLLAVCHSTADAAEIGKSRHFLHGVFLPTVRALILDSLRPSRDEVFERGERLHFTIQF